jgi:hypothetical protein
MARQKCVMNAMLHQLSPATVLTNFEKIAKASSAMVSTDIPASEVDRFMSLALKARSQPIATLSMVPPLVDTAHPDIPMIKRMVARAIAASEKPHPQRAPHHQRRAPSTVTGGSIGSMSSGYAANRSSDLGAVC